MRKLFLLLPLALPMAGCNTAQQTAACDLTTIAAQVASANTKNAGVQIAANYASLCPAIATDIAALAPTSAK